MTDTRGSDVEDVPLEDGTVGRASFAIAAWTIISRVSGVLRVLAVSAVLGPTYLGNTFQALNTVPNIAFELIVGSLFARLLVPALVKAVDRRDAAAAARVAGGFLGVVILGGLVLVLLAVVAGNLVLAVLGLGVSSGGVADEQQRVGSLLLVLVMPQVMLYGVAGTAGAVLNAHGRFALPAAAPVLENLGLVATMVVAAIVFGTGTELQDVRTAEIVVLGVGSTLAVGLHAGLLWAGATRVGTPLIPRAGWRDPEVVVILRKVLPSIGYTGFGALRDFAGLTLSNTVAGGVVAYSMATNFVALPVAVGARPLAVALLPRLARLHIAGALERLRDQAIRGARISLFVGIPAATAYFVLAEPLARAVAVGEMASPTGIALLTAALAGLAASVVGQGYFLITTYVSFARDDARTPLTASCIITGVTLAGMLLAYSLADGAARLFGVGASVSAATFLGSYWLGRRVSLKLPAGGASLLPTIYRGIAASAVMAVPAYLVATVLQRHAPELIGMLVGATIGAAIFVLVQRRWSSPELEAVLAAARARGRRL